MTRKMNNKENEATLLKKINFLEHEIEELKRAIIRNIPWNKKRRRSIKSTLFGSVHSSDITEEMIDDAKHNVIRNIEDI